MRFSLVSFGLRVLPGCALMAMAPLSAEGLGRHWYVDLHQVKPSLEGHFEGLQDGKDFRMDLKDDLALAKDKTKLGFGLEYQGPRFGVELSMDEQDYLGTNMVNKQVSINGQTWNAGARITTSVKALTTNFNWTIRALTWPQFWMGVDLGVRGMGLDLNASGIEPLTAVRATVAYKVTLPVPQVGLATGFNAFGGRLVGRGFYHYLAYSGATYTHVGADLRFFPIQWLGVRAFLNNEEFKIPKGSAKQDSDIGLTRAGSGFGIVARF